LSGAATIRDDAQNPALLGLDRAPLRRVERGIASEERAQRTRPIAGSEVLDHGAHLAFIADLAVFRMYVDQRWINLRQHDAALGIAGR